MTAATAVATMPQNKQSLIVRFAQRFGVDPDKMMATLKATAFRVRANDAEITNEQMMALLVVAEQYGLNPWTREIYAFPDKGSIVPVIGVDGWARIINEHPQFDGMEIVDGPPSAKHKGAPEWIECVIYRKDRTHPTRVRERLAECYRSTGPWDSHPSRLLRHKSVMQCARLAFGFVGVYDADEAQRIIEGEAAHVETAPALAAINATVSKPAAPAIEHQPATTVPSTRIVDAEPEPAAAELQDAPPPPEQSGGPTLADAIAAVSKGDVDLAHDLARELSADEARQVDEAIARVIAAQAKAAKGK